MTLKWHIWHVIDSWSLTAPIRHCSWANGVLQKTSGRRHLYSPSPAALLILDRRPPPLVQISSLPNLPLPLKSKTAAIILVKKILSTRSPKLRLLCTEPTFKRSKCLILIICNHNFWPIWFCETFFDANKRNENEPFVHIEHRCTCGQ